MELNSIINDSDISTKVQNIYKYIEKNEDKIDIIFDNVYDDLRNLYVENISRTQDGIEFHNLDISSILSDRNKIQTALLYQCKQILAEKSYLMSYIFKINTVNNTILLKRR